MTILVTGGAGFIGTNFIHCWFAQSDEAVINLDKLTYAGNRHNLSAFDDDPRYAFVHGDIGDYDLVTGLLLEHRPRAVLNFAAESHVDRSIRGPEDFVQTNVVGMFRLLEAVRSYWSCGTAVAGTDFRFVHISTDEVYGSLAPGDSPSTEVHRYRPNSPYAATKAGSDHLARAYNRTYGLPVLTSNCSNNYGPYQLPEKLIPLVIYSALGNRPLPIYGDGEQIRDWLYVKDHCAAILRILEEGKVGETYNVGGSNERTNLEVVRMLCSLLDELRPRADGRSYLEQLTFVRDRPGHDRRYAIDATKMKEDLGWRPAETFESAVRKTVEWYLENDTWVLSVTGTAYYEWVRSHYRLGGV